MFLILSMIFFFLELHTAVVDFVVIFSVLWRTEFMCIMFIIALII